MCILKHYYMNMPIYTDMYMDFILTYTSHLSLGMLFSMHHVENNYVL